MLSVVGGCVEGTDDDGPGDEEEGVSALTAVVGARGRGRGRGLGRVEDIAVIRQSPGVGIS